MLSKTSKMPGPSWSLPALETCPGSRDKKGELVDACKGCYATQGFYHMPAARKLREDNRLDWRSTDWVDRMVTAIGNTPYFRWFDSGDLYHPELGRKIMEVVKQTPRTKHWLPTRSYKIPRIKKVLDKMKRACDNIVVRYSSDHIDGSYTKGLHGSTIIGDDSEAPAGVHVCPAYTQGGKCGSCRECWNPKTKVVAYTAHTQKMERVIKGKKTLTTDH